MKTYLLTLGLCSFVLFAAGQTIKLKKKGEVDVAFVYNDPFSYIDYPRDRTFTMEFKSCYNQEIYPGLRNLSSMALRVRAWTILDDIVVNPVFVYKLNMERLQGNHYTVSYSQISKYPDLVKRYKAIRPTSVNAVVGMGLNPDNPNDGGAYAFFNIRNNDLLIAASEKTPYAAAPTSGNWGSFVQMMYIDYGINNAFRRPSDFQSNNEDKDRMRKYLRNTAQVAPFALTKSLTGMGKSSPLCNTYIKITWPVEAIDAIQELYLKYEKGEEKPPGEEAAAALAQMQLERYNRNDEWATPFEDDLKEVEAVSESNFIALRSKSRTIVTFDSKVYSGISELNNTQYFVLTRKGSSQMYRHEIVDKRGVPQEIDGHTYFGYVSSNNGVITADVYHTDSKFIASESNLIVGSRRKLYNSHEEVKSVVQDAIEDKIRRYRKYTANDPNVLFLTFPERSYFSRRITRYTTLPTLEIATKEEGYVLNY